MWPGFRRRMWGFLWNIMGKCALPRPSGAPSKICDLRSPVWFSLIGFMMELPSPLLNCMKVSAPAIYTTAGQLGRMMQCPRVMGNMLSHEGHVMRTRSETLTLPCIKYELWYDHDFHPVMQTQTEPSMVHMYQAATPWQAFHSIYWLYILCIVWVNNAK